MPQVAATKKKQNPILKGDGICACGCGQETGFFRSSMPRYGIQAGDRRLYRQGHGRTGKRVSDKPRQEKLKGDGTCACGCGSVPKQYTQSHAAQGIKPGDYARYVVGHNHRVEGDPKNKLPDYIVEDRGYKTPCWIWQRSLTDKGYATNVGAGGKRGCRVFYERFNGPIPKGHEIDHLCVQTECVNPDHLEAVLPIVNKRRSRSTKLTQDRVDKMRIMAAMGERQVDLAKEFCISSAQVSRIINYQRWERRI